MSAQYGLYLPLAEGTSPSYVVQSEAKLRRRSMAVLWYVPFEFCIYAHPEHARKGYDTW